MRRTVKCIVLLMTAFFVSCGVPSIFFMDSSDYTFTQSYESTYVKITSLQITSTAYDDILNQSYGPSVMFFYTIGTSDDVSNLFSGSYAASAFKTAYYPSYQGSPVSSNVVCTFNTTNSSSTTVKHTLYAFNKNGITSYTFGHPTYVLNADSYSKSLTDALLTYDTTKQCFSLTWTGNYTDSTGVTDLYRYNGEKFKSSSFSSESDYSTVSDADPYIYIYAAFAISPNSSSSFNNIFWSPLKCLGYIKLNQT